MRWRWQIHQCYQRTEITFVFLRLLFPYSKTLTSDFMLQHLLPESHSDENPTDFDVYFQVKHLWALSLQSATLPFFFFQIHTYFFKNHDLHMNLYLHEIQRNSNIL